MKRKIILFVMFTITLGICVLYPFAFNSKAETVNDLTFALDYDGRSYRVYDCSTSASGAIVIPDTYNGLMVTSIGERAFQHCTSLTSVTLPNTITRIEPSAFYGCTSLISIKIPDSVIYISSSAFSGCTSLSSITIPDSVTSIGSEAFHDCTSLTRVNITDLTAWCNIDFGYLDYFENCSNPLCYAGKLYLNGALIENLVIPEGLKTIEFRTFYGCTSLKSVTIPDSVTSIGEQAFLGCTSLTSVLFSDGVTRIGEGAFGGCCSLTNITLPDTVTEIESSAFRACTSLINIIIPDSIKHIGINPFFNTAYYNDSNNWENDAIYIGTNLIDTNNTISENYTIKTGTKCIADEAFLNCSSLKSIIIPNSLMSIGRDAFVGCDSLNSVCITDIASWCSIDFSVGVSRNHDYNETSSNPLYYAKNLYLNGELVTNLEIPEHQIKIGSCAFISCTSITSVKIPEGVTSIGVEAFRDCSSLTNIIISNSVTSIGHSAFKGCSSLDNVIIPNSLTSIADSTFRECSSLEYIKIPNSVTSIGRCAFFECDSLVNVEIPKSVINIGENAFVETQNLYVYNDSAAFKFAENLNGNYVVVDAVIPIDNLIFSLDSSGNGYSVNGFKSIEHNGILRIPATYNDLLVSEISKSAFLDCSNILEIELPSNIKKIGANAFKNTYFYNNINNWGECTLYIGNYLISVKEDIVGEYTIKEGITCIADNAFYNCQKLLSITVPGSVTNIGENAFYNCNNLNSVKTSDLMQWLNIEFGNSSANPIYYSQNLYINDSLMRNLVIPEGISKINPYAFYNCSSLTGIKIPESLKEIGYSAFSGCSNLSLVAITNLNDWCNIIFDSLTSNPLYYANVLYVNGEKTINLVIPDEISEIKKYSFCGGFFESLTIPNCVTSVGKSAFSNCCNLTGVYITDLGAWCNIDFASLDANPLLYAGNLYLNQEKITELILPSEIKRIKNKTFCGGTFESIKISDFVESIGEYAFYKCLALKNLEISDSVTSIGESAFYGCESLISAIISDGVTSIGDSAFSNCSSLTSVTIGDSVSSIGREIFYKCDLKYVFYTGTPEDWNRITLGSNNSVLTSLPIHYNATGHSHSVAKSLPFFEGMEGSIEDICPVCDFVHRSDKLVYINDYITAVDTKNVVVDTTSNTLLLDVSACKDINEAIVEMDGYALSPTPNSAYGYYGTGSKVQVLDDNGVQVDEYTLVVRGDVNGDSVCDVIDCMLLELAKNDHTELAGIYLTAADLTENGDIDVDDFEAVVNKAIA